MLELIEDEDGSRMFTSGVRGRTMSLLLLRSARRTSSVSCDCLLAAGWGLEMTGECGCMSPLLRLMLVSVLEEDMLLRSE